MNRKKIRIITRNMLRKQLEETIHQLQLSIAFSDGWQKGYSMGERHGRVMERADQLLERETFDGWHN